MKFLIMYLIIINAFGLLIMLIDKHNAIHDLRRIPERSLLLVALIGGSLGCFLGMRLFRHKTLHLRFSIGLPLMLALHVVLLGLLFYRLYA